MSISMQGYDEDRVTAESEVDFHSFNDEIAFSEYSSKNSSPIVRERQIAIDPLSLKLLAKMGANFFTDRSLSLQSPTAPVPSSVDPPVPQPKFSTSSLPSSPQFMSNSEKCTKDSVSDQQSSVTEQQVALSRSKSCGEGRSSAPAEDIIDILSRRSVTQDRGVGRQHNEKLDDLNYINHNGHQGKPINRDNIKCGCFFLPGVSGKRKQVVPPQQRKLVENPMHLLVNEVVENDELSKNTQNRTTIIQANDELDDEVDAMIRASVDKLCRNSSAASRAVSLEKFDCGSWSSSGLLDGDGDGDEGMYSYFDLPLELIRSGQSDTNSPVNTAFVFERDIKGVLKKSTSRLGAKTTRELSNRHVRFSTSMPTSSSLPGSPASVCITPRLRKAREEFNAFLEAQSA